MNRKNSKIDRRSFVRHGVGAGVGAWALDRIPKKEMVSQNKSAGSQIIITSHTNDTAADAMQQAWSILTDGGSALDAVERGANVIEVDPNDSILSNNSILASAISRGIKLA